MMAEAAPGGLERTEWSEVVKLGEQVSRQATVGFPFGLPWQHSCAGPKLHKSICSSAKNVLDSSFSLFNPAVSAYESCSPDRKTTIPQVTGTVWEACLALNKVPTTNCVAIG